jgi:predicted nucleotide-binding protein
MARRNIPKPEVTPPSVTPETGIDLMNRLIIKAEALLENRPIASIDHRNWENTAKDFLIRTFGSDSQHIGNVLNITGSFTMGESEAYYEHQRAEELAEQIKALRSVIEILETEIELSGPALPEPKQRVASDDVFIVHGSDDGLKETVARLISNLGLKPVILHEQPNKGRTLIEKLLEESQVGFAVILLTQDDRGARIDEPYEKQQPRARQNVMLELGLFIGSLGRNRVCALYQEGVEIPTDYHGVGFVPLDASGAWKLKLAMELRAVNPSVDLNKIA